jgi:hypothetical protein
MNVDISFGPFVGGVVFDLVDFEPYTGRGGIIKWAAFSEKSDPNDKNIFWSKPYEDEEIDEETRKALLYYVALEIRKIDYTCFRGEYVGKETKAGIDRIIGDELA